MRNSRFKSTSQLSATLAGFVVAILLFDSQALLNWAQKLDANEAQRLAVTLTFAINSRLAPLGMGLLRQQALAKLDLLGWSDDPARLASARLESEGSRSLNPRQANCPVSLTNGPRHPAAGGSPDSKALTEKNSRLIAAVPRSTPLPPLPNTDLSKPRVVALVGDSMMAVGLSDVLLRDTAADRKLLIVKAYRSGTGLARPDVFDWMQEYQAFIGDQQPDVIFVAIGANDGQGFVENGKVLPFASEEWIRVYEQRTTAFLNLLTAHGARVVWVGLPPMKSSRFEERTALINRIAYTAVTQNPLATWWNPVSLIGDEAGDYREFAALKDGKTTRIRAADGIHLSDDGASLLTPTLLTWLQQQPAQTALAAAPGKGKHL
jgi:hypothetical protein